MEDVYIVAIIFGFSAFVCLGVYKVIMAKIKQGNGINDENFDRLAKAFMQHKKEITERVQHLENIIAGRKTDGVKEKELHQIEAPGKEGGLTNDLKQKNKVKS